MTNRPYQCFYWSYSYLNHEWQACIFIIKWLGSSVCCIWKYIWNLTFVIKKTLCSNSLSAKLKILLSVASSHRETGVQDDWKSSLHMGAGVRRRQEQGYGFSQCSTGLKSGFRLDQQQTKPDQAGTVFM